MVLQTADASYPNLRAADFTLTLDGGPPFHPSHVRLEDDDPLSLTLLLDLSNRDAARLANQVSPAVAAIPEGWLTPRDHISIFAVDCSLVRSTFDTPFSPDALAQGLHGALTSPRLKEKPTNIRGCTSARLWDTIGSVIAQTSQLPGRRVVLILSNGTDRQSSTSWKTLQLFAGQFSTTLIGLQPLAALVLLQRNLGGMQARSENEQIFKLLCFGTGGTLLSADNDLLPAQLQRAITLLRQRYILQFPRPTNGTMGLHLVEVHVPDSAALVRPSGITFPMQDKDLAASPGTLHPDTSRAPVFGDRKILTQPR